MDFGPQFFVFFQKKTPFIDRWVSYACAGTVFSATEPKIWKLSPLHPSVTTWGLLFIAGPCFHFSGSQLPDFAIMVARPTSLTVRKKKTRELLNERLNKAAQEYKADQLNTSRKPRGLRVFANKYDVPMKSLSRRVNGKRTQEEYTVSLQKLSPAKEQVLVDFIIESADRGFPLNQNQIVHYANAIVQEVEGDECPPLGVTWISGFRDQHSDVLQTHWSKPLDTQRARSLNPDVKRAWFELVKKHIVDTGIQPGDIYRMDESGFTPSHSGKERVWGRRGTKTQHKQGGANCKNVTALVTICADGSFLRPMVIFKGKNFMSKWNENNIAHAS